MRERGLPAREAVKDSGVQWWQGCLVLLIFFGFIAFVAAVKFGGRY